MNGSRNAYRSSVGFVETKHYRNSLHRNNDRNGMRGDGKRFVNNRHNKDNPIPPTGSVPKLDTQNANKTDVRRVSPDLTSGNGSTGGTAVSQSSQMPGIAILKNSSTTPFANDPKRQNGSSHAKHDGKEQVVRENKSVEAVTDGLRQIDLKPSVERQTDDHKKETEAANNRESTTSLEAPLLNGNNTDKCLVKTKATADSDTTLTRDRRAYSVGGVGDNSRYKSYNRFHKNVNDSVRTNHINNNKFYPNDRFIQNNNKNDANDHHNKRPNKLQQISPQKPKPNNQLIYDCMPNVNVANPYQLNGCQPIYHPYPEMFVNYYPIPMPYNSMVGQPPAICPNTGLNIDQNLMGGGGGCKSSVEQHIIPMADKNPMSHFAPFEPSPENPFPPTYIGYIQTIGNDSIGYSPYFVSVYPPNITPLRIDVALNGVPILPSNCLLFNTSIDCRYDN